MGMHGIDVSHWNNFDKSFDVLNRIGGKFVMIKVSEGSNWRDDEAIRFAIAAKERGMEIGFYHYCRSDVNGNNPEREANNFLLAVDDVCRAANIERYMLAVDWEGKNVGNSMWLYKFCNILKDYAAKRFFIYGSRAWMKMNKDLFHCFNANIPFDIWVASPEEPTEVSKYDEIWKMHQYSIIDDVDCNYLCVDSLAPWMVEYATGDEPDFMKCHCCGCIRR